MDTMYAKMLPNTTCGQSFGRGRIISRFSGRTKSKVEKLDYYFPLKCAYFDWVLYSKFKTKRLLRYVDRATDKMTTITRPIGRFF